MAAARGASLFADLANGRLTKGGQVRKYVVVLALVGACEHPPTPTAASPVSDQSGRFLINGDVQLALAPATLIPRPVWCELSQPSHH